MAEGSGGYSTHVRRANRHDRSARREIGDTPMSGL